MAIIGKINDKVLIDDLVFREEPEVLTRWQDPTIEEKDKEIERLKKENNDLRKLYHRTSEHLFDMGDAELARYFQAQIDECPTFYVEPIIDYYKEYNKLNNIIDELEKDLTKVLEDMYNSLVHIDGKGYYSASLVPLEDTLDKLKELKEGEQNENLG